MKTIFLPTTSSEMRALGWDQADVILVTGDAYIDSPYVGVSVIGRYLQKHGFKVGVIGQPSDKDILRLGEPCLFWGVTGGCIDSMVANYTPLKKWRKQDDYTPGGLNRRPDRAVIAYANLIRRHFKHTVPIVLGGIEASLRRVAHYDYWDNKVRRSVLFDAKADALVYGMGEKTVLALARSCQDNKDWRSIPGLCYIAKDKPSGHWEELCAFEEVSSDKDKFWQMFDVFSKNTKGFLQKHNDRYLVHNHAPAMLTSKELDEIYELPYSRDAHPFYKTGEIRALETIRQSVTTHQGCFGQCHFCAIAAHQGKQVVSRSESSVLAEVKTITQLPRFNGIIYDVGGPTANMYGCGCQKKEGACSAKSCLMPQVCRFLGFAHDKQAKLLKKILDVQGVKKVFVSSGIRHDLVAADKKHGPGYVDQLVAHHVSGQIKVAPEHYDNEVLSLMNKPSIKSLMRFKDLFDASCRKQGKKYFMTYYLMAAHPGCTISHMHRLKSFLRGGLRAKPEQIQIFTPTPSTLSSAMYHCEKDPQGRAAFVEKSIHGKDRQKQILRS